MLDLEYSVKKPVCIWIPEKIKSSNQIKLTFHQKCGLKKENKLHSIFNAEFVPGLHEKEHMNLEKSEMTKMLSSEEDRRN